MKRFTLLAFAFIGLAACDAPPTPTEPALKTPPTGAPSFEKLINEKFPVSGTLSNPCPPGELVAFEGFFHLLVTGDATPNGVDQKVHVNLQGVSGVGLTSGDRYSIAQNEKTDISVTFSPFMIDQETDFRFRMIRQGSDDNFWSRVTFRFSFPPFQFEIIRNESECRG